MKRLLFFLLLFGAGVALLWKLEQQFALDVEAGGTETTMPLPTDAPRESGLGVSMRGRFGADLYDDETGALALRVGSEDSLTAEGVDRLFRVTLEVFDTNEGTSGASRGTIKAREARLPRTGAGGIRPEYSRRIQLDEVSGTFDGVLAGSELEVETPSAVVDATRRDVVTLEADTEIKLSSPEFRAGGIGYQLDVVRPTDELLENSPHGQEDVIELRREGWLEFQREVDVEDASELAEIVSGRFATTGTGALQIRREGKVDPRPIALETWEGGELVLFGSEDWRLSGEHMLLRGTSLASQEILRPEKVVVEGEALWRSAGNEFRARDAEIGFDEHGAFRRALLEGYPHAQLQVSLTSEELSQVSGGLGIEDSLLVDVRSTESIEITSGPGAISYVVAGPATVETEGFRLRSNGDLVGRRTHEGDAMSFHGSGGVDVETPDGRLEAAEFELRMSYDDAGLLTMRGTASGGARVLGKLAGKEGEEPRSFTITSPERLEVERIGTALRVVEGDGVEVSVSEADDSESFYARCDRLTDLEVEAQTFFAEGNVFYRSGDRTASCARLDAKPGGHFTMWGTQTEKAVLSAPFGEASALMIDVEGNRVRAEGAVEAEITSLPTSTTNTEFDGLEFDAYDLACDELDVTRGVSDEADGTVVQRLDLLAVGSVRSTLATAGRTFELRRADRMRAERVDHLQSAERGALRLGSSTLLTAEGEVAAHLALARKEKGNAKEDEAPTERLEQKIDELDVFCDRLDLERTVTELDATEPDLSVVADGNVRFEGTGDVDFQGEGEILRIAPDRTAHLEAPESGSVRLYGTLPTHGLPFRLVATRADFSPERIEATNPQIRVTQKRGELDALAYRGRAKRLVATPRSLELMQAVRLSGTTEKFIPWTLDATRIVLEGTPGATGDAPAELSKISATGGIVFQLGGLVTATADSLFGVSPTGVLRLSGDPAVIETTGGDTLEADWMEYDPELQIILDSRNLRVRKMKKSDGGSGGQSGPGQDPASGMDKGDEDDEQVELLFETPWHSTRIDRDSFVVCFQQPRLTYPSLDVTLQTSWAVLWIDRDEWDSLSDSERRERRRAQRRQRTEEELGPMRVFFDLIDQSRFAGFVREAYFEGPIELFSGEDLLARSDAVYLDVTSGHGWISNATINLYGKHVGQGFDKLIIKAKWLRHSRDRSLRADSATVTSCDFDEPHVKVVTGDLRMTPLSNDLRSGYEVSLADNRIEMYDLPRLPLPKITIDTDKDLKPDLPTLVFGDSARFGSLFGIRLSGSLKSVGNWFHSLFSSDDEEAETEKEDASAPGAGDEETAREEDEPEPETEAEVAEEQPTGSRPKRGSDAKYDIDASYLGSRGGLLDVGFRVADRAGDYAFNVSSAFVYDTGKDEGYMQVPRGDRDNLRLWLRSNGWFSRGDNHFQVAYSDQSDPGVQAEFFESDFTNYEQYENYVQWKRTEGLTFKQATAKVRVDEFSNDVEELPEGTYYSGRGPVATLGSVPLVHSGEVEAGYLRRRRPSRFDSEGNQPIISPFRGDGTYPDPADPFGSHNTVRADTVQTLETPIALGKWGLKLVPFLSAQATGWSNSSDDEDDASRLVAETGTRLSTVFWKPNEDGSFHQISPYVGYAYKLGSDFNGQPYTIDETELETFGDFVEIGARTRFGVKGGRSRLDLDVRGVYAYDRTGGEDNRWLPIEAFGRLGIQPRKRVFDLWYDGRYDVEDDELVYSLASLGTRVQDDVGVQVTHTYGRDQDRDRSFDAVTFAGFYRWTPKWEFEARQTISLLDDERLGAEFLVRRYGHDIVFEVETQFRDGEGSSLAFNVTPRLAYRPNRIGYIDW